MAIAAFHECPKKGCPKEVPDARFACPLHWAALPSMVRERIWHTAGLNVLAPERRGAIRAAQKAWGDVE